MKTNATEQQLNQALELLNSEYDNNIRFKSLDYIGGRKWTNKFSLAAIDSNEKGGRISYSGRRIGNCACWHVHGHFFEALFSVDSNIFILSVNGLIDSDSGNWQGGSQNIGSGFQPMDYQNACHCGYPERELWEQDANHPSILAE